MEEGTSSGDRTSKLAMFYRSAEVWHATGMAKVLHKHNGDSQT